MIRAGEIYPIGRDLSQAGAIAYWMAAGNEDFIAEEAGTTLGTYHLRPNQAGGGQHVCNCGYVTAPDATGRRVARRMCEHSIIAAGARSYRAMQFNFVVSSNKRAVSLWQKTGFAILGKLPSAFLHPTLGYVDAFVMYRS